MFLSRIYRPENLCSILHHANNEETPLELIHDDNFHIKYLREYLGPTGLDAKFYIEESEYISIDYLTDYSYYYSESFHDYPNKCVRLHFFTYENEDKPAFDNEFEEAILQGNSYEKGVINSFWDKKYLGFIVIRPIPKFMIGYTILRHYNYKLDGPNFDRNRVFWATKDYDIHVFGCHVKINSLAFLSQDSNVAACATIAVWCMLQRAVENYYINLKSPYEITQDAGLTMYDGNRVFPNSGLDIVSICNAITKCNLATEITDLEKQENKIDFIKKYVNAYSAIKLPIILGLSVPTKNGPARHAVAICGHHTNSALLGVGQSLSKWVKKTFGLNDNFKPIFRCGCIDKLYLHDDQWGPFSRGEFVDDKHIETSWTKYTERGTFSEPLALVIPVFPQIRISFIDIEEHTIGLNQFFTDAIGNELAGVMTWDIQLHFSSEFKDDVRKAGLLDIQDGLQKTVLFKFLKESLPKYIWVSTLYINDHKTMHFIYDATGLRHTSSLLFSLCYYPVVQDKFSELLNKFIKRSTSDQVARQNLEVMLLDSVSGFYKKISKFNF